MELFPSWGKILIWFGCISILAGLFLTFGKNFPFFHWIGRLPGDIRIEKENYAFYFPWVTCVAISLFFSLLKYFSK